MSGLNLPDGAKVLRVKSVTETYPGSFRKTQATLTAWSGEPCGSYLKPEGVSPRIVFPEVPPECRPPHGSSITVIFGRGRLAPHDSVEGQARFREIGEALDANRGAGNSYNEECRNPDEGGNPGRFYYPVSRADITPPKRGGKFLGRLYNHWFG